MRQSDKPEILMLSASRGLSVSVLYCIRAAGYRPVVVGGPAMRPLRFSRYCKEFVALDLFDYIDDPAAFSELLNGICERHRIDVVIPGDYDSQKMLCDIREKLAPALFPMSSAEQFAELNDKWKFQKLCERLSLPVPKGIHFLEKSAIDPAALEAELGFPIVVKPTGMGQSEGLVIVEDGEALQRDVLENAAYTYSPLVVQKQVNGRDVGFDIFAVNGEVVQYSVHDRRGPVVIYFSNDKLVEAARRIARALNLNGVYDFDAMVSEADGSMHLLECNARFWGTVAHAQWCGANYASIGIAVSLGQPAPDHIDVSGCSVCSPAHLLVQILTFRKAPWRLTRSEKVAIRQGLGDPVAMILRALD